MRRDAGDGVCLFLLLVVTTAGDAGAALVREAGDGDGVLDRVRCRRDDNDADCDVVPFLLFDFGVVGCADAGGGVANADDDEVPVVALGNKGGSRCGVAESSAVVMVVEGRNCISRARPKAASLF